MPKILLLVLIISLSATTWVGFLDYQKQQRVLGAATQTQKRIQQLEQEIKSWQKIASASPTYRDAYIQLAVLNYQLNSSQEARLYLEKALELDPNWGVPPELAPLLE